MRLGRLSFSKILQDRKSITAIEFAICSPVFFALLFAIFEISLMFLSSSLLDTAVSDASRKIRTGQTQGSVTPENDFKTTLCDSLLNIVPCNGVVYDVRKFNKFSAVDPNVGRNSSGLDMSTSVFMPGSAEEITMVRVSYQYSFITPLVSKMWGNADGKMVIVSSTVFKVEPYE